jgi:hypothetical protein
LESREANILTWENHPDCPAWVGGLLEELGDAATIAIAHRQAEVMLTLRILKEQPPDAWAQAEESPSWMRSAIAEYSASASRWEQVRHVADLELLAEVLGEMMESGAE